MKRVVITGIGIVSCLGNNQKEVYDSLLNSKSGISFSEKVIWAILTLAVISRFLFLASLISSTPFDVVI